jgi:putative salt-induced outer membrane protein
MLRDTGQSIRKFLLGTVVATIGFAGVAHASMPSGIEDLLKTAIVKDDRKSFDMVVDMAVETWPASRLDILRLASTLRREWLSEQEVQELIAAEAADIEAEKKSRARGIIYYLDPTLWNAQAQVGAASSTGDTDEQSASLGLSFSRDFSNVWEHNLNFDFDFARSKGATTRRRLLTRMETLYKKWEGLYLLNYVEVDLNKFSGFDYRILDNVAIGKQLFKSDRQSLRLEGGPGVRFSKFEDTGLTDTEFLGRVSSTYDLKLTDNLTFKDKASVIFGTGSMTIDNRASFAAQINSSLAARLSFQVQYDSETPVGAAAWDTITRATLVYDF